MHTFFTPQISGRSLDDIVVAVPRTPAHGAVARLRSEVLYHSTYMNSHTNYTCNFSLEHSSYSLSLFSFLQYKQVPSSQGNEEEEFSTGAWAAMKAEMGLDERNPSCFLHSYSIVMVLRKVS